MKNIHSKIGVFINNNSFDSSMTSFKKRGINIETVEYSANLEDFSSIFVDLQYPLEMSYKFISKVSIDPSLSHINLIAIVSEKSDLQKITGLQNARICDYVSSRATFEEILKKLKFVVSPDAQPTKHYGGMTIKTRIKGSMSHISESGCLISSKVLFRNHLNIEISSNLINQATGKKNTLFKVSKNIAAGTGVFFAEVDFVNLSDKSRTAIRKMILNWTLR